MYKTIFFILLFGNIMLADFKTMSTKDVQTEISKGTILIDIRREDEWKKYGIIENSHRLTFFDGYGKYDINKWMEEFIKIVKTKDQKFILVCAHANRTKTVGEFLSTQLRYQNVYELDGGINYGWIDKGLKTIK
ncbi:rhodanese-like domain-containing protein [Arcobacteraceae bacterium]|nr:rhodanese-like domain-containing protein [Arcobacteraceae bacterium]